MKYIITESQYNKTIDKFISFQFEPHEEKRTKNKANSIFWVNDGEVIAEMNEYTNRFLVEPQIWDTISSMFSLEFDETQKVIKDWLEEHYKLGGLTPERVLFPFGMSWKNITNWED